MRRPTIRRLVRSTIALSGLMAVACGGGGLTKQRLSIATGGTGGVYYPYGGGLAKIISANLPNTEATAEVTSGSVDNLKFIRDGKSDIAFTLADTLDEAVKGRGAFEGRRVPAAALAVIYTNFTHVVTLASSGINEIAGLRGKVVATGAPGSGTEVIAFRTLEAAGIDPTREVQKQGLGVAQAVDALKDGKIDAFFWSGGVPTAAVLDLANTPAMTLKLLPNGDLVPPLQQKYRSLYHAATIPKSAYPGLPADVPVIGVANLVVVHAAMPEQLAYDVTRLLFEKQHELAAIHPQASVLTLGTALIGSPAPFHKGAIRYYREKSVVPPPS
ncbi:MAG: TAXI family TRAP transporter solute-binding subunit [Acidobacteria bacterium]|nr:TAXI family TRAP transporter solute-binding subunit [Acidobacteriota bacterium]